MCKKERAMIIKYLDCIYPHYNWTWLDVLRHTCNGDKYIIQKLKEDALLYCSKQNYCNYKK